MYNQKRKKEIEKNFSEENKEQLQNNFINDLHQKVSDYNNKVNKKDYSLTLNEQRKVTQIYHMIKWIYEYC